MSNITAVIRHSGFWNAENCFVNYTIDAIVFKDYASYDDLVAAMANQVRIDTTIKTINIRYMMEGDSMPLEIHNDMCVRVYVELIKENKLFGIYTIRCISEQCVWKLKASSINRSTMFKIKEFVDKHTCPLKDKGYSCNQASSGFVVDIIKPKITNYKRKYTPRDIIDDVINEFGVEVSYMKAYRAKERVVTELRGDPADSYKKLPGYVYILDKTYLGSYIRMLKNTGNEFLYLFVALYAFIKGFDNCRPTIVVDGSHLKSEYNGTFGSASTLDGTGILKIQFLIICLRESYGIRENMCIVSDRHESIIKAASRIYPGVPHFACIWHLWKNVYSRYRKSHEMLSGVFYSMANAYTQEEFGMLMEKVEKVDIRVKEYLDLAGREKWARLYAPVNRAWTMTSNIAESINSTIVQARELPIYDFLEEVILATEYLHTVIDDGRRFIVYLEKKTCTCKEFQIEEMPCPHARVVLKSKNLTADNYCSNLYKPETVVKTYDVPVYPLPDKSVWKIPASISEDIVLHRDIRDLPEGQRRNAISL
ncbi:uncharacterized protein LOC132637711 [Lycium barbarum]|uniref:uncharacterized protein LOC132637711 n=1 Tax=Lycium barbarum TaxID=112863 RepID=UPI00293EB7C8|nr:uncharacterized protein LOC132637711 [Lycium barbarum]